MAAGLDGLRQLAGAVRRARNRERLHAEDIDEAAAELTVLIEAIDAAIPQDDNSVRLESGAIAVAAELTKGRTALRDAFHEQHSQVELAHSPGAEIQLGDGVWDGTLWRFPIVAGKDRLGAFVNERVVQAARVALEHVRSVGSA